MTIRVQAQPFDPGTELNALHAANLGIGAVVTFVGYVRDFNEGREVGGMFLEHFPGMTEKALGKIADEAGVSRDSLVDALVDAATTDMKERITEMLDRTPGERGPRGDNSGGSDNNSGSQAPGQSPSSSSTAS